MSFFDLRSMINQATNRFTAP